MNSEIAFFGGSFTAIDREYMISLLEATKPYIDKFRGIRLSTRPDYIDEEILSLLKKYSVTTIELGAQSMCDTVLEANNRGHDSQDVIESSLLIKKYGFDLGLQMMTGLYKATAESDIYTAREFIKLKPECVRIYPTVVMKDTRLGELFSQGIYATYSLEESLNLCSELILMFEENDIDIIRLGLHYSDSLIENSLSDSYHPAFKELCENKIFYDKILKQASASDGKNLTVMVNPKSRSKAIGQKRINIDKLNDIGYCVKFVDCDKLSKYQVIVKEQE